MDGSDLEEHVRQLARDLGFDVFVLLNKDEDDTWGGEADCDEGAVLVVDPPRTPRAYLTVLHELGHLAEGCSGRRLDREANAWIFAINASIMPLGPDEWQLVADSLGSYESCTRCKPSELHADLLAEARRLSI